MIALLHQLPCHQQQVVLWMFLVRGSLELKRRIPPLLNLLSGQRPWLLPPDNRWRLRSLNGYWHRIGGNKATNWLLTPIGGTISHEVAIDTEGGRIPESRDCYTLGHERTHRVCGQSLALSYRSCGRWVLMFSVGINLYLVPTINGDVKYQPKHVSSYGMILKLEADKACMQH